ncbi:c-type cytochrome [Marinimicrobium sp. ABcell2]|uniref:c-type cytochrome n=1 Tax=Marinimicrobium sp. ABcell2 TaxID=3069751 RepID=UPI0027B57487|nr:c-type cytochrome [Marinimicrobium sp. ABcell2]MDQ2078487.1 c-type cytochrome [Marinimicrobium sp. ABcell2]
MVLAIVIVLLVLGTVLLHILSPWWLTPIASNWSAIDTTINITFWVTGIVFVAVNLFMAYAIYQYRYKKERRSHYDPENKKLELWLGGLTTLGIAAMLAPGLIVWGDFVTPPEESAEVEVLGQQWHWMYRFPGEDGQLGETHPRFMSEDNPFGIDPSDPAGQDDILVFGNILHLPVDQPVRLVMRAKDVIHNFAVPHFRAKIDMVPGMVTSFWLEPTRIGEFDVVCMVLCGMAHHAMRGKVVVESPEDHAAWLAQHPTFAQTQQPIGDAATGQSLYASCASCHGPEGQGNRAMNAPKISGLPTWYLQRQLRFYNDRVRGFHQDDVYGQQMAAMMAVLPTEEAIDHVVAYIDTLPDEPAPTTIDRDIRRGESLYRNCASCHGDDGRGNYATSAPPLAGQHDWYLKQQLENYQRGIRGSHSRDYYGSQMMMMARTIHNDQAMLDLITYINSL